MVLFNETSSLHAEQNSFSAETVSVSLGNSRTRSAGLILDGSVLHEVSTSVCVSQCSVESFEGESSPTYMELST